MISSLVPDETTPLGSGAYGTVYRGSIARGGCCSGEEEPTPSGRSTVVAVKTVHSSADPAYFKALLGELKIMTFLPPHDNIVNLVGACTSAIKESE